MARTARQTKDTGAPVEGPWPLPDGWRWERLGDVANINPARSFAGLSDDDEVVFVPMAAVTEETGHVDTSLRRAVTSVRKGYTKFRSGDVILAKITPCMENGKLAVVPSVPHEIAAGSTEFHVVETRELDNRFLFFWLVQRWVRHDAEARMTGSAGQRRVPADYLRQMPLPVPPLPVQRRIVARIDALFAEIEAGEQALAAARDNLETYRKALLKAAVTGDLTADWRAANPPAETGDQLLARILAERRARWAANPKNKGKKYIEPTPPDTRDLPALPEGWTWASLGQVTFISGGVTVDKKRAPATPISVPYLRVANVQRGQLDLAEVKTITIDEALLPDLRLQPGDILLNEGGDRDKVGRGWVWEGQIETCVHQNHVFKARPASDLISPFALSMYLNEMGRQFFIDQGKQTTNLASISLKKISQAPIPVSPAAETSEILKMVELLLSHVQRQVQQVLLDTSSCTTLRQSILSAAFKGELVR